MRRARWKRKNVSAGRSAPARTSCRRRGKVGCPARQSGTETRCPWGSLRPGEVPDTLCADFTRKGYAASVSGKAANGCAAAAADLPLRDKGRHIGRPLHVGGALTFRRGGPACPPAGKVLRGTIERQADSGAGAMRFSAPMTDAANTRRKAGTRERSGASRQKAGSFYRHRFGRPPSARRHEGAEARQKAAFSFGPVRGPFSFQQD